MQEKQTIGEWPKMAEPLSATHLEFPLCYTFTDQDLEMFRTKKSFGGLGFWWVYHSDEEIYIFRGEHCYYRISINPGRIIHSARLYAYPEFDEDVLTWIKAFNPQGILNILFNWTGHSAFPEYEGIRIESAKDLPISYLHLPAWAEKRIKLAVGSDVTVGFFRNPFIRWYAIIQDFDLCISIAEKISLLGFYVPELRNIAKTQQRLYEIDTKLHFGLKELKIPDRLIELIEETGVTTIDKLVSFSARGLDERGIVNHVGLSEVRKALQKKNLLLKDDYLIKCKRCGELFAHDDPEEMFCDECKFCSN